MAVNRFVDRNSIGVAEAHFARVADGGCVRHPHLDALLDGSGPDAARNLADAVHLLCSLHGKHPGLIEIVLAGCAGSERKWLSEAANAFEQERLYLVQLTAAVGPLPSTPGAAETEASLLTQRKALETLAASERRGCGLGAASALVGDWPAVRSLLDRAASRAGLTPPPSILPDEAAVAAVIESSADSPSASRALAFGAEQLLLQHRGLFDLLEARAEAREGL